MTPSRNRNQAALAGMAVVERSEEGMGPRTFQDGGSNGRASFQMDECSQRMAVSMVCFRRQYRAFVLLYGEHSFYTSKFLCNTVRYDSYM